MSGAIDQVEQHTFPGAHRPERRYTIDSCGVGISVVEWGDAGAPPLLFAHGGFDFAETLNVFAPLLAAGGWRVVSWDQRGHGDSQWAHLYSWEADVRDALGLIELVSDDPVPLIGHSKGGAISLQLASVAPHRIARLVNLDGLPSRRSMADVAEHERTKLLSRELGDWLDYRGRVAGRERKPGSIADLARRRGRMNERLSDEWLRYLVTVGAARHDDGWRWKIDPTLRLGGFGPWRPEWSLMRMPSLRMPVLAVLGLERELMGWGTLPEDVIPYLPDGAQFEALEGVGHFVHIEQPQRVAELVLSFLGSPRP